jgi:hypothetical protein
MTIVAGDHAPHVTRDDVLGTRPACMLAGARARGRRRDPRGLDDRTDEAVYGALLLPPFAVQRRVITSAASGARQLQRSAGEGRSATCAGPDGSAVGWRQRHVARSKQRGGGGRPVLERR